MRKTSIQRQLAIVLTCVLVATTLSLLGTLVYLARTTPHPDYAYDRFGRITSVTERTIITYPDGLPKSHPRAEVKGNSGRNLHDDPHPHDESQGTSHIPKP